MNLDRIIFIIKTLREEASAPTMNLGSGKIAGTTEAGDDPPVHKKRSKKYSYGGKNSRKWWLQYLRKD
jgi:hypothetical protein